MSQHILMPTMNFMTRYYYRSIRLFRFVSFKSFLKIFLPSVLLGGIFLINSCEEAPTFIGKDILPSADYVSLFSTDTFRIQSYTRYDYPVSTESQIAPYIGNYYDPYFGSMTCEFVSQLRLEREWVKGTYDVDSVKLYLRILTVSGSNSIPKQLRITEISDMIYNDSSYYSNTSVDTADFGVSVTIPPLRNDTINNIEIAIPAFFGEYLIRNQDMLMYNTATEDFRNYFKGVYLRLPSVSDSDPLLLGLNINSYSTIGDYTDYIQVFMHSRTDNSVYSFRFLLDPLKSNANFVRVARNFNTADPGRGISGIINQDIKDTLSYLQGINGVYTKIIIPGLEDFKKNSVDVRSAINKARLFVPVHYDESTFTESNVPEQLYLRYYNKAGKKVLLPDYFIDEYHEYFGGQLDTANNRYNFNISNFIQEYLNDKDNILKPELEIFQSITESKNVIIKANNSKSPLKLELTITKY